MYLDVKLAKNKTLIQAIPASYTGFIYTLKGKVYVGEDEVEGNAHHTLVLSEDGTEKIKVVNKNDEEAHFVVIAGQPLREPIVQHGPFVMNTENEIMDTFNDYQQRKHGFEKAAGWRSTIAE
ncbi:hypothetical protein BGZ50_008561 [Haplosporangium sp. Z 11]|nr:hypothetical protein BGZ50_008561 [Haplosporangium sp. Z 11]